MRSDRFEYFLNAVHYCLWRADISFTERYINRPILGMMRTCIKLLPESSREKYTRRMEKNISETSRFYFDRKSGLHIGFANHFFGYFYSGYPGSISFILAVIPFKLFNMYNYFVSLLTIMIPIGLAYIPAYKAVFSNDKYLEYYKKFEREDSQWHKKWEKITLLFCLGSVTAIIIGIIVALTILLS